MSGKTEKLHPEKGKNEKTAVADYMEKEARLVGLVLRGKNLLTEALEGTVESVVEEE